MKKKPIRVAVTGGGGRLAYSLIFRLIHGELFGKDQPIFLSIRDIEENLPFLKGIEMEIEDSAASLVEGIMLGSEPEKVFEGAEVAFLIGSKPRGPGMERKDLLEENAKIFVDEGKALGKVASRDVKVLVVGNPCNTNCLIAIHHAKELPRKNFQAMMRLDHNRAVSMLAKKAVVGVDEVKGVCVWGNHSSTQVPDFTHATIKGRPITEVINDLNWLKGDFVKAVRGRGAEIIAVKKRSSEASAAHAALSAMRSLYEKTAKEDFFSTALYTQGNPYGIDEDLVFGFPVRSKGEGDVEIVKGLELDGWLKEQIALTQKELMDERDLVAKYLR